MWDDEVTLPQLCQHACLYSVQDVCCNCGITNSLLARVSQGASPRRVAWIDVRNLVHRKWENITLILIGLIFLFSYFVKSWYHFFTEAAQDKI